MNKFYSSGLAALLGLFAVGATADTEELNSTAYHVVLQEPTPYETPQGNTVLLNGQNHASVVAEDGEVASQYCSGNAMPAEGGGLANGAGHCTVVQSNGDVLWVWYKINGAGEPATFGVIGGTGQYEGASGGGTSTIVSQGGDGRSWVSKTAGTITTP